MTNCFVPQDLNEDEDAAFAAVRSEYATAMETVQDEMGQRWEERVKLEQQEEDGSRVRVSVGHLDAQLVQALHQADMIAFRDGGIHQWDDYT
jgi:hypothetical protein